VSASAYHLRVEGLVEFRGVRAGDIANVILLLNARLPSTFSLEDEGSLVTLHASGHTLPISAAPVPLEDPIAHIERELGGLLTTLPPAHRIESSLRAVAVHADVAEDIIFLFTADGVQAARKTRPAVPSDRQTADPATLRLTWTTILAIICIGVIMVVGLGYHIYQHGLLFHALR
jgi:hypothetical protein